MSNCVARLLEVAQRQPNKTAIRETLTEAVTYLAFHARVSAAAESLKQIGVVPGDTVLLMAPASANMYAAMTGILAHGARVLFIEPWMSVGQVADVIQALQPKAFVYGGKARLWGLFHRHVRAIGLQTSVDGLVAHAPIRLLAPYECASVPADQAASIVFSSGTFGDAKGIVRTHENVLNIVDVALRHSEIPEVEGRPDLALFSGMTVLHLFSGRGSILVPNDWNTSEKSIGFFRGLQSLPLSEQPSSTTVSPAFLSHLLDKKLLPQLKSIHIGGAVLDVSVAKNALSYWTDAHLVHVYGCSEAEPICLAPLPEALTHADREGDLQVHFIGKPIPELAWEVDHHGLWVSGPHVSTGYVALRERAVAHKRKNSDGVLFHLTNDRVVPSEHGWLLYGRTAQDIESFQAQREAQRLLNHTNVFVHRLPSGARIAVGEGVHTAKTSLLEKKIADDVFETRIVRDKRHASRVDVQRTLKNGSLLRRLIAFSNERSPLVGLALVCGGPVVAASYFAAPGLAESGHLTRDTVARSTLALMSMMALFFLLRLTDELKDYEKDCRERPTRPLPRGLLSTSEVSRVRLVLAGTLLLGSLALVNWVPLFAPVVAVSLAGVALLEKDFFCPRGFETHPLRHAVIHQLGVVPFYALPFSVFPTTELPRVAAYVMTCMSSSLCFEFARKLDPKLPPETRTYERVVGFDKARLALIGAFAILGLAMVALTGRWWVGALALGAAASSLFLPGRGRKLFSIATQISVLAAFWSFFLA